MVGPLVDVLVGELEDRPPVEDRLVRALPVALALSAGGVRGLAAHLDEELAGEPRQVDPPGPTVAEAEHPLPLRCRHPAPPQQLQEATLEPALGTGALAEQVEERRRPGSALGPSEPRQQTVSDGAPVAEGGIEHGLETGPGYRGGQVEERALHAGGGEALDLDEVGPGEVEGLVHPGQLAGPRRRPGDEDLRASLRPWAALQPEQMAGGEVGGDGRRAGRHHRRSHGLAPGGRCAGHAEDAGGDADEPPRGDPAVDGRAGPPERSELSPVDQAVLAGGDLVDGSFDGHGPKYIEGL